MVIIKNGEKYDEMRKIRIEINKYTKTKKHLKVESTKYMWKK